MRVKSLQFEVIFGNVDENVKKVEGLFEKEDLSNIDTVVLPEMWTTGYDLERISEIAADNLFPVKNNMQKLAVKYNVNIIAGSIANKVEGNVENTAFVINREGNLVYEYSKMHLVPMLNEPKYLSGGNDEVNLFDLDNEKAGVVICYDLRFPEIFRDLSLEGVKVIFVVAEWPIEREEHWTTLLKARAIENQCYIVSSNVVGTQPTGTTFAGNSMIIDPFGEVLNKSDSKSEESIEATLDLEYINKVRKDIPIFESRRKELYKFL